MRIAFVRAGELRSDPGPQPLRYASVNGRQFYALVSPWPEVRNEDALTGVYHASGHERPQVAQAGIDVVAGEGFDALRPASMIFEYVSLGPLAQLAIALGCKGPFWSFDAGALAGMLALQQALADLEAGRCDQALVASYLLDPPAVQALLVRRGAGPGLTWSARATGAAADGAPEGGGEPARPDPALEASIARAVGGPLALLGPPDPQADPHGLGLLGAAMAAAGAGSPAAAWSRAGGRVMMMGFGLPAGAGVGLL